MRSERLLIRPFRATDGPALFHYRSDPDVARYQSWETPVSVAAATAMAGDYATHDPNSPGWFQWAVELDGTLVGDVAVGTHDNLMQAEIGFTLAAEHQGRGYGTEAVRRVVEHLLADRRMHRISAECDARNLASARLLTRVGFRQEGLLRAHTWIRGEWTDDLVFGLLAADYAGVTASSTVE
ncbi:GNAT family protein [Kibdelosporangium lantanae]